MADKKGTTTAIMAPARGNDDVLIAIREQFPGVTIREVSDFTGGEVVEKSALEGVPFVVTDWTVHKSDTTTRLVDGVIVPGEFVVVNVMTADGERKLFTDGGVGIRPVLEEFTAATETRAGLLARRGLRVSGYTKRLADGSSTDAETWYFG